MRMNRTSKSSDQVSRKEISRTRMQCSKLKPEIVKREIMWIYAVTDVRTNNVNPRSGICEKKKMKSY
jgi:hypothetical protein